MPEDFTVLCLQVLLSHKILFASIMQLLRRQRRISSEGKVDDDGLSRAEV